MMSTRKKKAMQPVTKAWAFPNWYVGKFELATNISKMPQRNQQEHFSQTTVKGEKELVHHGGARTN